MGKIIPISIVIFIVSCIFYGPITWPSILMLIFVILIIGLGWWLAASKQSKKQSQHENAKSISLEEKPEKIIRKLSETREKGENNPILVKAKMDLNLAEELRKKTRNSLLGRFFAGCHPRGC